MKSLLVICLIFVASAQCARHRRQIPAAVAGPPDAGADTPGMNIALDFMVDELEKEEALGGPANPAGIKKATDLATKIGMMGGSVDQPTQDKLADLTADFVKEAAKPDAGEFMAGGLAKPEDTNVNIPVAS